MDDFDIIGGKVESVEKKKKKNWFRSTEEKTEEGSKWNEWEVNRKGRLKSEIEKTCEKKWLIDIKNLVDSSQWMIDEWIVIVFSFKSHEREREIEIIYKSFNSYI